MTALIPDTDGYYDMTLSCLTMTRLNDERLYISSPQSEPFFYNVDQFDKAVTNTQAKNNTTYLFSELGFPSLKGLEPGYAMERMFTIQNDRIGATIKPKSIRMITDGINGTVEIKALVKPYVSLDVVVDGMFIFGLRAFSKDSHERNYGNRGIDVRYLAQIVTWDLIGVEYHQIQTSNDIHKLKMMSEVIPPITKASPDAIAIFHNILDFTNPKWPTGANAMIKKGRARNWKEFVGEETRELWPSFNSDQRIALCKTFTSIAEWVNAEE